VPCSCEQQRQQYWQQHGVTCLTRHKMEQHACAWIAPEASTLQCTLLQL
jgi:hypothetical protein